MTIKRSTQLSLRDRAMQFSSLAARIGVGVALLTGLAGSALAQPAATSPAAAVEGTKKTVAVVLTQFKVVTAADGRERLEESSSVKPGDVLEYRATYTNNTGKAVTGLVADLPIPEGLEYLPKSAKPGATLVKAATKDGAFGAEPLMRKSADGARTEPVPYSDYRTLRWTLGQLPANGVTAVSARARVEVVVPPEPKTSAAAPQAPPVNVQPAAGAAR